MLTHEHILAITPPDVFFGVFLGAMQTPEEGTDSTSTVPIQTTVPVQPAGSTQQLPVQQQVNAIGGRVRTPTLRVR